jgi:hypothetical protein
LQVYIKTRGAKKEEHDPDDICGRKPWQIHNMLWYIWKTYHNILYFLYLWNRIFY